MRNRLITIIAAIVIISALLFQFLALYTDWVWFDSVNFGSLFTQTLMLKILAGGAIGLIVFILVYTNLSFARRLLSRTPSYNDFSDENIEFLNKRVTTADYISEFVKGKYAKLIVFAAALFFAIVSGFSGSQNWMDFARFINMTPFGVPDPLFGTDLGYYIFRLPFFSVIHSTLISVSFIVAIGIAAIYYFVGLFQKFQSHPGSERTFNSAISHLSILGAFTLLVQSLGYRLDADHLMYSPRGVAFGASYTDLYASRPIFFLMIFLAIAGAILFLINIRLKRLRLLVIVPVVLIAFSTIVGSFYPAIIERFVVTPNALEKESPYIENNINFTRQAYGLSGMQEKSFPATTNLTQKDLEANAMTVDNIRLHDLRPLIDTYNQIEAIRPYYDFLDVDIDRYVIDGRLRQLMISPRELNVDKLDASAQTWINIHLKYTHGQGAVVSPVNQASAQGLPTFFVQQIPPKSTAPEIAIEQPDIYFGELTDHYIITNTDTPEIDYTSADGPITTYYAGSDGIKLSFLNKILYSIRMNTYKLLLNQDINSESKLLINRNIKERVQKLAPFLLYDADPYLVIHDNRLFWIIDAYTYTDHYPYSEPYQDGLNYINNSVKVVIDAYNGTTNFYLFNENDPLARTYQKIFPKMFTSMSEMPEGLKSHIRYPETLFRIQSQMLLHYHMTDVNTFFYKDDAWKIANEVYAQSGQVQVDPTYLLMRLPDEEEEEFILMLPFTPAERNNLVAWMAARMDKDHYGELVLYQFPRQEFINGTLNIENRIDQDTEISQQLTLWSQQGSGVIRGNMMVIPIEDSLLYVEPIYLKASAQGLPELKRIVVAYGDTLVMERTLGEGLAKIFGGPDEPEPTEPPIEGFNTILELTEYAQEIYTKMNEASQSGNWAEYGVQLEELRRILAQLELKANEVIIEEEPQE